MNVVAAGLLIDPLDKRRREAAFLTKEDSDFFHRLLLLSESERSVVADYPVESPLRNAAGSLDSARDDEETRVRLDSHCSPRLRARRGSRAAAM